LKLLKEYSSTEKSDLQVPLLFDTVFGSVVDPKPFVTDPDPTFQRVTNPDPDQT
jgi:hypothetical protein